MRELGKSSRFRTTDPSEANMFLIPVLPCAGPSVRVGVGVGV